MIRDWFVNDDGQCEPRPSASDWSLIRDRYYLHRFLTEVEDLLNEVNDEAEEWDRLPQIRLKVRQLVTNSYWVQTQYQKPCPKTGVAVLTLYDEIGYPLTVQTATFAPGVISPIHNHGSWGVVALMQGKERHTFWRRVGNAKQPFKIEQVGERTLYPGEMISFSPKAIHHVEAIGSEPTVSFTLYGQTQPKSRFEFNPITHTAKRF